MDVFIPRRPRKLIIPSTVVKMLDLFLARYPFFGSDDPVGGQLEGVQVLIERYRRAGIQDISYDFYPGGRHEKLNEINRHEVLANLAWISAILERQEGLTHGATHPRGVGVL
jgi:hypothetical protein